MTPPPTTNGPESIVVSLEMAKKLKEAGWRQSSNGIGNFGSPTLIEDLTRGDGGLSGRYFKWCQRPDGEIYLGTMWDNYANIADAPTAEEILRRLPSWEAFMNQGHYGVRCKVTGLKEGDRKGFIADTLANAAAAMFCHLSKHNLLPS